MTDKWITAIVTVLVAIVSVAVVATLLSPQSKTSSVIGAATGGFQTALCAALSPLGVCSGLRGSASGTITFGGTDIGPSVIPF